MTIGRNSILNESLFELADSTIQSLLGPDLLAFLRAQENPWNCLGGSLKQFILGLIQAQSPDKMHLGNISSKCHLVNPEVIFVGKGAVVEAFAHIEGPTYIAPGAVVRHGAYVRGNVYLGAGALVGHTTEAKGTLLMPQAKAAHFAYLGDSILGVDCNLGAGTKLANLRLDHGVVKIRVGNDKIETSLTKMGAVLGNRSQTGCNSVTNPGTILLPDAFLLPNSTGLGVIRRKG